VPLRWFPQSNNLFGTAIMNVRFKCGDGLTSGSSNKFSAMNSPSKARNDNSFSKRAQNKVVDGTLAPPSSSEFHDYRIGNQK
jgi:hypothetical protein